ncbi:50S ribosomal protein L17 [Candidatus Caldatribacterium saccharofermentans]|uniref:50S ribosomal protein L17 n=2 Tax=Candidatus Caldatribacterium TaxID=1454725 RepID=A0A7V4WJQ4_9BACT
MRHRKRTEKLGRKTSHKESMLANMIVSLIKNGRIETTEAKGKVLKRYFERVVSLAIRGDNASMRQVVSWVRDKEAFKTLLRSIVPRMKERKGGYCRLVKTGFRIGDGAPLVLVEIVE